GKTDRTAYWTQNDAEYYVVSLYRNGSFVRSKDGNPGTIVKFYVTEFGSYTISVAAYKGDLVIGEGSKNCNINPGDGLIDVSIMLDPKQKGAEINIQINWNDMEEPVPPEPVTNYTGFVSENLLENGDADIDDYPPFFTDSGCTYSREQNGASGNCWKITQPDEYDYWQELCVDLTEYYGRGKSYLISFKIKADPEAGNLKSLGYPVRLGYSVYSGAVQDWALANGLEYYDWDDSDPSIVSPWFGGFMDEALGTEYPSDDSMGFEAAVLTDDWVEYNYVIPATEIDRIVNNSGLFKFYAEIYMGEMGKGAYSYLIDDLSIKDLNAELRRTGRTWVDPNEDNEDEDDTED
ncbi:MAG: hypothetical protein J6Y93_02055, partial [Treponema sp.]|nr:hypothetical protein [Treponema sp.]